MAPGHAHQDIANPCDTGATSIKTTVAADQRQQPDNQLPRQDTWLAIQETLYLASIPEMVGSIREGLATPLSECSTDPGW